MEPYYEFGDLRLISGKGLFCLTGEPIKISPKPLALLNVLVEANGQVVTTEVLLDRVWTNSKVGPDALTFNVFSLRKALGPTRENLIENVPRVGYRISLPVSLVDPTAPAPLPTLLELEVVPSVPSQRSSRMLFALLCVLGLAIFGIKVTFRDRQISITSYDLVTTDGGEKTGPLLFDGSQIFFRQHTASGWIPASVRLSDSAVIPFRSPVDGLVPVGLASQGSTLLLTGVSPSSRGAWSWSWKDPHTTPQRLSAEEGWPAASPDGGTIAVTGPSFVAFFPRGATLPGRRIPVLGNAGDSAWSPDGRTLRFCVSEAVHDTTSIWEASLTAPPRRVLAHFPSNPCHGSWMRDGKYYVFGTEGVSPQDLWYLETGRTGTPNASKLTSGPMNWRYPTASDRDDQIFAIGQKSRGELVQFDRTAQTWKPFLGGISAIELDFSPDHQHVVYTRYPEETLWVSRINGSDPRQITGDYTGAAQPHFSPDSKRIAFIGKRPNKPWRIYAASMTDLHPAMLLDSGLDQGVPTWLNNTQIVLGELLHRRSDDREMAIWTLDLSQSPPRLDALEGSRGLWTPRASPDGRWIVALTFDSKKIMLLDTQRRQWTELGHMGFIENPVWMVGDWIYGSGYAQPDSREMIRIHVPDGRKETLVDLRGFFASGYFWLGVTPEGNPIGLHGVTVEDIYALKYVIR